MGIYRLFLAVMVVISHIGIYPYGFNTGVIAVISFFLLSGYVMTMLIQKYYNYPSTIPIFYLDRVARLFPQFLFYTVLASVFVYFNRNISPFVSQLTYPKWILNFLMLPQGFYMYWGNQALLIPQTWSLGLELTFYLVIPFILLYCSRKYVYILAGVSFLVFLTAYMGLVNTDQFGYRLLPGTLFMFLVGSSFFAKDMQSNKFRIVIFSLTLTLLIISIINRKYYQYHYNKEVLIGLLFGMMAVKFLEHFPFKNIDEFFGNLSYGVYLNHMIIIWVMQSFFEVKKFNTPNIAVLLTASCTLALLTFRYIERPALRWRHSLRYRTKQRLPPAA
jgi:peptidoglycan/LPS O-acetylase OafA/YrhL